VTSPPFRGRSSFFPPCETLVSDVLPSPLQTRGFPVNRLGSTSQSSFFFFNFRECRCLIIKVALPAPIVRLSPSRLPLPSPEPFRPLPISSSFLTRSRSLYLVSEERKKTLKQEPLFVPPFPPRKLQKSPLVQVPHSIFSKILSMKVPPVFCSLFDLLNYLSASFVIFVFFWRPTLPSTGVFRGFPFPTPWYQILNGWIRPIPFWGPFFYFR